MAAIPHHKSLKAHGVVGLAIVVLAVGAALGAYQQVFTSSIEVTVVAERAGLLLDPGSDVRLRGIKIGSVRSVSPGPDGGAILELALDPEAARGVPADTTAEVLPATVFGSKNVHLVPADGPVSEAIADGAQIRAQHITTETNNVFRGLENVLTAVRPSRLNATLGSVAAALDGRGDRMGQSVSALDSYLEKFNPSLGALQTDLEYGADVADTYADVAPDVLAMARSITKTSATLTETQPALHALLLALSHASQTGKEFLALVEGPLVEAMHQLEPTTALLARYSPALTCTVKGLNEARKRMELVLGGQKVGIQALGSVVPSQDSYKYPRDLPTFATGHGPNCLGLPYIPEADMPSPRYLFDDGMHNFGNTSGIHLGDPPVKIFTQLLGPPPAGWGKQ